MTQHIFWLTSYPKSGNTLTRLIIYGLFFSRDGLVNLKGAEFISNYERTGNLDFIENLNKSDFNKLNNLKILSKYYLEIQKKYNLGLKEDFGFFKTHSANIKIYNNFFTKQENIRGYIYVIRDPRDVAISWSHYSNTSLQESINFITNEKSCINWHPSKNSILNSKIIPKVVVSNWRNHLNSWTKAYYATPKLIIKYEDLINTKENVIMQIIDFFEQNFNIKIQDINNKIKNIIKTTDFEYLKIQEQKFNKNNNIKPFFRNGRSNQWKSILTDKQNNFIVNNFKLEMKKYGYI